MNKVIENIELLKKLQPYLENMIPEHSYYKWDLNRLVTKEFEPDKYIKTLTLEEAIEFLPNRIDWENHAFYLEITKAETEYHIAYCADMKDYIWEDCVWDEFKMFECTYMNDKHLFWETLLEAIEKMLEYLLDNELLWKTANQ